MPEAKNGDIVAVAKLAVTATGDTLTVKANPIKLEEIVFPEPTLGTAIEPKSKGDEDKLSNSLQRLMEEDPTIRLEKNTETKQTILHTMGESHTDIIAERCSGIRRGKNDDAHTLPETIRARTRWKENIRRIRGHGQYGRLVANGTV